MNLAYLIEETLVPYIHMFGMSLLGILMHENLSNLMESSDKTNSKPWANNCKIDFDIIASMADDSDDDSMKCMLSCELDSIGIEMDKYKLEVRPTPLLVMSQIFQYNQSPAYRNIEQDELRIKDGLIKVRGNVSSFCQSVTSMAKREIKRYKEHDTTNGAVRQKDWIYLPH